MTDNDRARDATSKDRAPVVSPWARRALAHDSPTHPRGETAARWYTDGTPEYEYVPGEDDDEDEG